MNSQEYTEQMLKQLAYVKLSNQFDHVQNPKCLYVDKELLGMINYVYEYRFNHKFREHAYAMEYNPKAEDVDQSPNIIFFLYARPIMMEVVANMIITNQFNARKKNYYLYLIPQKNFLCIEKLQILNVFEKINIKSFNFDLIPLKSNLFSLELPSFLDSIQVQDSVITSLLKMSNVCGKFQKCLAIGKQSTRILKKLEQEYENFPEIKQPQQNNYLILLDRSLDYITPMLTPFTYEGLLDVLFGINLNQVEVPGNLMESQNSVDTFLLNNPLDKQYQKIASMNIHEICQHIQEKSDELSESIKFHKNAAKSLQDLNNINEKLMPEFMLLQIHKQLGTFIIERLNDCQFMNNVMMETELLQDCLQKKELQFLSLFYPIEQVLKVEVLSSQVSSIGSYYNRNEKYLQNLILQCFPMNHLLTLHNLQQKKIIYNQKKPQNWMELKEKLDLIPDNPHCYTYIYLIYSCMLVRIVQMYLMGKLGKQIISLLTNEFEQKGKWRVKSGEKIHIWLIGGITVGEAQAFQLLANKIKLTFVICTTQLTSGAKIIKNCFYPQQY